MSQCAQSSPNLSVNLSQKNRQFLHHSRRLHLKCYRSLCAQSGIRLLKISNVNFQNLKMTLFFTSKALWGSQ